MKRPDGVLLGTHWPADSGEEQSGDRTWWIAQIGSEIQIREIPNLLIPRKDGFWWAGTKQIREEDYYESYIWATPVGIPPENYDPDTSGSPCHDQETVRDILFIGSGYLALKEFGSALCANYGESTQYYVSTLDDPNWSDHSMNFGLEISQVLGPAGLQAFNKVLDSIRQSENANSDESKNEDIHCGTMGARPSAWAIRRQKGRWVMKGKGSFGDHVCDGYYETEFDVKLRPPKTVVGYDELPLGWSKIERVFPGAKDAFEAPNRDFLIVLTEKELVVSRLTNGELGTIISRHPLRENEYAVMSQWALGDNVARWDQQARQFSDPGAQ